MCIILEVPFPMVGFLNLLPKSVSGRKPCTLIHDHILFCAHTSSYTGNNMLWGCVNRKRSRHTIRSCNILHWSDLRQTPCTYMYGLGCCGKLVQSATGVPAVGACPVRRAGLG